jgi:hypothetical protein
MVRDDDAVDPDFRGAHRVRRVQNAFDDEGARKEAPIAFEVAPGLRRGRGLSAAECDDIRRARPIAGMRRPIPEGRRAAMAHIIDDPARMGHRLQYDRRLQL